MRGVSTAAVLAACIAAAGLLSFRPIYEPDLWWHLAHGRENAAGRLVRTNVFSFNYPDYRQRYTSWAFDSAAYAAWTLGGAAAVQAQQAAWLALAFAALFLACRARAPTWSAAVVLLLGVFVVEPRAIPRPHLVSFAGMAVAAWLVARAAARRTAAPLWWAVPLVAVWGNFHVECVFGLMLVAIFAAGELAWPSALVRRDAVRACAASLACAAATMANPYGWGLLAYLYENWSVPSIVAIAELQPPPWWGYTAFYVYLALLGALFVWQWRRVRPWEAAAAVAFAALGARFIRFTPLVVFATAPMVAARLADAARGPLARALVVLAAVAAAPFVSRVPLPLLVSGVEAGERALAPPSFFSAEAIAAARRAGLSGPVFNSHNLGGWLAWTLYPQARIFQDSRLQAYPPEHFLSVIVASYAQEDWNVLVADVDWAVVSLPRPNQMSGVGRFPADEWEVLFRDEAVEILGRR